MSRTHVLLIALAGFGAPGCLYGIDDFGTGYSGRGETALQVQESALDGEAGAVALDEPTAARVFEAARYGDIVDIEIRARGRGGVLMQRYSIEGFDRLTPGDELVVDGATPYVGIGTDAEPEANVSAVGCSGPRDDEWEFDQMADEVTLQVEEGPEPDTLRLNFTARFDSYYAADAQTVQGSVVVAID